MFWAGRFIHELRARASAISAYSRRRNSERRGQAFFLFCVHFNIGRLLMNRANDFVCIASIVIRLIANGLKPVKRKRECCPAMGYPVVFSVTFRFSLSA
jgi:hypothetical protein